MKKRPRKKNSPQQTELFWFALASVLIGNAATRPPKAKTVEPETIDVQHIVVESKLNNGR